ncbi:FAD-dependent oxidoreductase [Actinoplanes bogorensis]|uniref:FAD-dependent oxidoreductase n=1 Tax=Paractinoplanes bogorensis TaxID=1610840 RepID=A0ABS5YGT0_9ACTN|nr:FAD-dependent oxidoreductase [Actinoplanes bogorensis]MBU2662588.1 FAD-dependent oxidoreductase [Actinoplanes bogorensis]
MTKVVIIGAGVVGCALADELTMRGWTDVTVLEQGPLFVTGGSSSHAPGLVFQTNPSRTMTRLARYTVEKLGELGCFRPLGSLEVATTPERLAELHRRFGYGQSWGIGSAMLDPVACAELVPLLDKDRVLGGLHVPTDGLALAVQACEAQAARAQERGARFVGRAEVTKIIQADGRVVGVWTADAAYPADIVVSCAGFWGPKIGELADTTIPLLPMAHQFVRTSNVNAVDDMPILRHQDRDLYFRAYGESLGIGSYLHEPMPVSLDELAEGPHPSMLPFTPETFAESWDAAAELLPALRHAERTDGFNGVFSFTADGFPLLGESRTLPGFWTAEAIWVTHSAGAAREMAEWLVNGRPSLDLHECDLNRFDPAQLAPDYTRQRSIRSFEEVYDILHPLDPPSVRNIRVSAFHARQTELGAVFGEAAGWERPLWYGVNAAPDQPKARDEWSSRHWSPIAETEARITRERVALYDMTSLMRLEVEGPVSFLQGLTSNNVDKPVGSVTYTLLLDSGGGVRSDVTVARLGEQRFQVGVNGPIDLHWLRDHAPAGVRIRDITGGTCGLGVWGPRARDLVAPLTDIDVSAGAFRYFQAREGFLGTVPVTMLRLSYVGELGWEIYARADHGLRLWDTLWEAGRDLGLIAAGRAAFSSLRLEKGYRLWGTDMTAEDSPYEAGLGFAVRRDAGDFLGRDALVDSEPERRLTCLLLADAGVVPMGREPVYAGGGPVGFVTSAAYGHTVGAPIAYAWLPAALAVPGTEVTIGWFDRRLAATVAEEPLFDPKHERLRG